MPVLAPSPPQLRSAMALYLLLNLSSTGRPIQPRVSIYLAQIGINSTIVFVIKQVSDCLSGFHSQSNLGLFLAVSELN